MSHQYGDFRPRLAWLTRCHRPMSIAAGLIHKTKQTAGQIVEEMVAQAVERLETIKSRIPV